MYSSEFCNFPYWWLFPLVMIVLCFFMMRGGRAWKMCGFGPWRMGRRQTGVPDSAIEILNKRYASGEINKEEYEEKKRTLTESADFIAD
jgi:putative membrane protein